MFSTKTNGPRRGRSFDSIHKYHIENQQNCEVSDFVIVATLQVHILQFINDRMGDLQMKWMDQM